jgi:hypothetical protein
MLDEKIDEERNRASMVRDGLRKILVKMDKGKVALPCELSVYMMHSGPIIARTFLHMACTAVIEKYRQIDKSSIAANLMALRNSLSHYAEMDNPNWQDKENVRTMAHSIRKIYGEHSKRLSQHRTRFSTPDIDLLLCTHSAFALYCGITPWICQQADLRYRWTETGMAKLVYLESCWTRYTQASFSTADFEIGLTEFPLSTTYYD